MRGHVYLTLVMFTLANAYRTKQGQMLAGHGIRRYRAEQQSGMEHRFGYNLHQHEPHHHPPDAA